MSEFHIPRVLLDQHFYQDPYSIYAALRESSPVAGVAIPSGDQVWLVTRHDDIKAALKDAALSLDGGSLDALVRRRTPMSKRRPFLEGLDQHMLNSDPPGHTRLRRIISRAFTTNHVENLRPRVEAIVSDLLDRLHVMKEFDIVADYAWPLPIAVISEMLGIPVGSREQVGYWSRIIFSDAPRADRVQASHQFSQFLHALVREKRAKSSSGILGELLNPVDGAPALGPSEMVSMIALLLVAGHETTMNLIGNAARLVLLAPDLNAQLVSDPSLVPAALEEFLRFDGPVNVATMRHTIRPAVVSGTEIPAGELVLLALASANRDESKFQAPDTIDIRREQGHLAFGYGIHSCIGARLARLEGTTAILRLVERFPDLHLMVEESALRWRGSILMRGLTSLPASCAPRHGGGHTRRLG
jgi:cytochrome P450